MHRAPDIEAGPIQVWKIDTSKQDKREDEPALQNWLIKGPWHPAWQYWILIVMHLRDVPYLPPAKKHRPDVTHEFLMHALNPEVPVEKHFTRVESGHSWPGNAFLTPADFVVQTHGITDEQAEAIGDLAIKAVAQGMSPDQDYRRWWQQAIENSARHARGEATQGAHR